MDVWKYKILCHAMQNTTQKYVQHWWCTLHTCKYMNVVETDDKQHASAQTADFSSSWLRVRLFLFSPLSEDHWLATIWNVKRQLSGVFFNLVDHRLFFGVLAFLWLKLTNSFLLCKASSVKGHPGQRDGTFIWIWDQNNQFRDLIWSYEFQFQIDTAMDSSCKS